MASDPFVRPITKRSAPSPGVRQNGQAGKKQKTQAADPDFSARKATIEEEAELSLDPQVVIDEEEEDDRFFGGGLTEQETQALDYLDANDKDDLGPVVALDLGGMRKMAARFEKAITKNQKMRARYVDDPARFLESEAELDQEVKNLSVLSEYPELIGEFVNMQCLSSLISLIGHENSDIACGAIQVLDELTDADTSISDDNAETLIEGLTSCHGLETLVQNLFRLDESIPAEHDGVFKTMSILENVINIDSKQKLELFHKTKLCDWLLLRMNKADQIGFPMSENRQYAAELLSILSQDCVSNVQKLIQLDAVDAILMLLAPFRKRDPEKSSVEEEYLENLFDILDIVVTQSDGKDKFIEGEGIDLMQRLILDSRAPETRLRALRALEYACGSWSGGAVCQQVVEVGLLRTLFAQFMKKDDNEIIKACLGIFVSFFRTLNDGEPERIRVLNKFIEDDHAKVKRLVHLRRTHVDRHDTFLARLADAEAMRQPMTTEDRAEYDLTKYLDRLDNGLDTIQLIDVILAWLAASDETLTKSIVDQQQINRTNVRVVLKEMIDALSVKLETHMVEPSEEHSEEDVEVQQEREMLEAILEIWSDT